MRLVLSSLAYCHRTVGAVKAQDGFVYPLFSILPGLTRSDAHSQEKMKADIVLPSYALRFRSLSRGLVDLAITGKCGLPRTGLGRCLTKWILSQPN